MKGDIPGLEYLPLFHLPFLEFSAFQVAFHHTLVEFLSEFIKEIGAAVVLASLHVHIDVVAVFDFHAEDVGKDIRQFLHTDFSIVDTVAGVKGIKEFDQVHNLTCPTELLGRRGKDGVRCRQQSLDTHVEEFQLDGDDVRKFFQFFSAMLPFRQVLFRASRWQAV